VVKRKVPVSEFLARKKLKSKATESLYRLYLRIYFTGDSGYKMPSVYRSEEYYQEYRRGRHPF
jgi:hypothetical protein